MYFDLTDEQKQLSRSVERMLSRTACFAEVAGGRGADLADRIDRELHDLGITSALVSEAGGGLGMGLLTLTAVADQLGRHCAPGRATDTALGAWAIERYGDAAQKTHWLPKLLDGSISCAFALGEPDGAWTPETWRSTRDALLVTKVHVKWHRSEDLLIVGLRDGLGITSAETATAAPSGVPLDPSRPLSAIAVSSAAIEHLCDLEGASRVHEALLVLAAAEAVGAGQRALEMSVDYAKMRRQFDRPISAFQALRHQLAGMALDIAPAHFPCWHAAHLWDLQDPQARRAILMSKAHGTDMAVKVARAAVECHGGIAYTWDYPLHLLLKRAMYNRVTLGSPRALRRHIAQMDDEAWRGGEATAA